MVCLSLEKINYSIKNKKILKNISLKIKNELFVILGKSGCGKTIVALGIMRLLPKYAHINGEIRFNGNNLLALKEKEMRKIRGQKIAMIFEQPGTCLNPVFTIGSQIAEAVKISRKCSGKKSQTKGG